MTKLCRRLRLPNVASYSLLVPILMIGVAACSPHRTPGPNSTLSYRLVWTAKLDENADSSPVVVPNAVTVDGKRQSLVLTLAANNVSDCEPANPVRVATLYAFLESSGRMLWKTSTHGPSRCSTSSPAVRNGWVYSPGFDGKIHRYALATGMETIGRGWPVTYTLSPNYEKVSSPLRIFGHYLFVTTSGYHGHPGRYQGHMVVVDLKTATRTVWNSLCSNIHTLISPARSAKNYCPATGSGIWARTGVERDPLNGNVIVVTGNGPWNGTTDWADSILEFTPDGKHLVGSFTPPNARYLGDVDLDLGSTSPAILPAVTSDGRTLHLAVQAGKGPAGSRGGPAVVWLLYRDLWSGSPGTLGGQLDTRLSPYGCEVLTAPALWKQSSSSVLIFADDCAVAAYRIRTSPSLMPRLVSTWLFPTNGQDFTTPVIAHGILYIAHPGAIVAYNPLNGHRLWSSAQKSSGGTIGNVHWEYPAISGHMLFMTDERGKLYAYRRN